MRGLNKVIISGNVTGSIEFGRTGKGDEVCGFHIASDRHTFGGSIVTAFIKINVYTDKLVRVCKGKLVKGVYVLVEGELMNRDGQHGGLTEVRAKEIIFLPKEQDSKGDIA